MSFQDSINPLYGQYYPDGLDSDEWVQYLINTFSRQTRRSASAEPRPTVGIVRKIEQISKNKLPQIKSRFVHNQEIFKNAKKVFVARVEIPNHTNTYEEFLTKERSEIEFYTSMPLIVIGPTSSNNRVTKMHEYVLLTYLNEEDFTTAVFAGFPYDEPVIDPNLSNYYKGKNSAKKAFENGQKI